MSETYTVTAKTVDEAINLANQLYGGRNKEISHEIISTPKKGFLGIGSKDAIIRVTVVDTEDDGLNSIVDELKNYKSQSAPETGYYTPAEPKADKKQEQKKPEQKKNEQKKPEAKKAEQKKPSQENKPKNEHKVPAENVQSKIDVQPKIDKKDDFVNEAPKAEKADKNEQNVKTQKQEKNHKKAKKSSGADKNVKAEKAEKLETAEKPKAEARVDDVKLKNAVSDDEMKFAVEFINAMIANMKLSATAVPVAAPEGDEFVITETETVYPAVVIDGDDTGILIGHHGETLDAIQYLVNLALFRRNSGEKGGRENIKITVDIENYREKREETLRALARRMAARAVKYKRNVFLEPMNPYERRIIHSELQSYPDVATHSVGSDTNRKIIITYEGADKAQGNKKRGRNNRRSSGRSAVSNEQSIPQGMPLPTLDDIEE